MGSDHLVIQLSHEKWSILWMIYLHLPIFTYIYIYIYSDTFTYIYTHLYHVSLCLHLLPKGDTPRGYFSPSPGGPRCVYLPSQSICLGVNAGCYWQAVPWHGNDTVVNDDIPYFLYIYICYYHK